MNEGPVAQLSPIHNKSRCCRDVYKASMSCPANRVPIGSIVPWIAIGTLIPEASIA